MISLTGRNEGARRGQEPTSISTKRSLKHYHMDMLGLNNLSRWVQNTEPNSPFTAISVVYGKSSCHHVMEAAHTFLLPGGEPAWLLQMKSNLVKAGSIPNPVHHREVKTLLAEGKW